MHVLCQPRSLVDKCRSKSDRLCLIFHFNFPSDILSSQRWLLIGSNWHLFGVAPSSSWWLPLIVATAFLCLILYLSVCSAVKGLEPAGLCNCMAAAHFSNASPCQHSATCFTPNYSATNYPQTGTDRKADPGKAAPMWKMKTLMENSLGTWFAKILMKLKINILSFLRCTLAYYSNGIF